MGWHGDYGTAMRLLRPLANQGTGRIPLPIEDGLQMVASAFARCGHTTAGALGSNGPARDSCTAKTLVPGRDH